LTVVADNVVEVIVVAVVAARVEELETTKALLEIRFVPLTVVAVINPETVRSPFTVRDPVMALVPLAKTYWVWSSAVNPSKFE
jgi:hypothetical protein